MMDHTALRMYSPEMCPEQRKRFLMDDLGRSGLWLQRLWFVSFYEMSETRDGTAPDADLRRGRSLRCHSERNYK